MKKLLFLLTTGLVFTTSCLNTNYVFSTINFISKVKSNLKTNQNKLNSLLYSNHNNEFENSLIPNSNGFELKNYNSVFLKSLAYDHSSLKLTSTLTNLINYDLKHHVSKTDTYLDKIDYLKMNSLVSKDKKETLIGNNLAFLNHFFNDQSVGFNPGGYIVSRRSLLNTNNLDHKTQGVLILKNLKKYIKDTLHTANNNKLSNKNAVPKLSISWSGVYFTTNHKLLTHRILNILNGSASYINAVTYVVQKASGSSFLRSNGGYFWDSWTNEDFLKYLTEDETGVQTEEDTDLISGIETDTHNPELLKELNGFRSRVLEAIWEGKTQGNKTRYSKYFMKALTRFAKQKLGIKSSDKQDPFGDLTKRIGSKDKTLNEDLGEYAQETEAVNQETTADAADLIAEATAASGEADAVAAEAASASADVPILDIIMAIITLVIIVAIPVIIDTTLKKIFHWKLRNPKIPTKGPWSLKQIWFNQKTRMFRKLTSDEIQFNGHFFKPWFGKIQFHANATKPIAVLPKYITKDVSISPNLHQTYNLITGTNNNFNLVINPAILKQVVASSYLPNPEYSVKQVLALNKLNYNNLNLSNDTWINLIRQIKHPYVNSNYAAILNFKNKKIVYNNIKANQTTNFHYQNSNYLQEMFSGDKNTQDLITNSQQLQGILNDLGNVKREWNDIVYYKTKKIVIKGIKNSNKYNPDHYSSYVQWYYYHFLKPSMWIDSHTNDAINIAFLTRIFTKLRIKGTKYTLKQALALKNNNKILDLSSNQF